MEYFTLEYWYLFSIICVFYSVGNAVNNGAWSIPRPKAASCQLPVHAYYDNVHQVACAHQCFSHAGCTTYKFLQTGRLHGHCQVLVPTAPLTTIAVPDKDSTDWKCFTAVA